MKTLFPLLICSLLYFVPDASGQSDWTFDGAHSNLQFSVTNFMITEIEGSMVIRESILHLPDDDLTKASITIIADVASIDTDNDGRDEHLRSADFFDAAKYPDLIFKSNSFKQVQPQKYEVTGQLSFHGKTNIVTMEVMATKAVRDFDNKTLLGFRANGTIKRTDFDISSSTPSAILSDEVKIRGNVVFLKD